MEVSVLRAINAVSGLLLVVGVSFYTSTISAENRDQIRIGHLDFDNIPVIELKEGQQGDLEMEPVLRNIGHGLAPVYLYRLPDYSKPNRLFLTTIVSRQKIFYPIVALLNEDRQPVDVIKRPVNLKRISQVEVSSSMSIIVNPQHKYMLITTDPAYFGEHLSYKKHVTSMIREYDGFRVNYVPVTTGTRDVNVVIGTSGRLALSVPENDY
ncbi:MAG: hypothetical protein PVH04_13915 [Gammaproteobacteria bacterium]|jgi:hypothetical protein